MEEAEDNAMYSTFFPEIAMTMFEGLKELASQEALTDVSLKLMDGTVIKAHKIILASVSGYFRDVFLKFPEDSMLCLGREFDGLKNIVKLIYGEELDLASPSTVSELKNALQLFEVRDSASLICYRKSSVASQGGSSSKRKSGPRIHMLRMDGPKQKKVSLLEKYLLAPTSPSGHAQTASTAAATATMNDHEEEEETPLNLSSSPPLARIDPHNFRREDSDEPRIRVRTEESLYEGSASHCEQVEDKTANESVSSRASTVFKKEPEVQEITAESLPQVGRNLQNEKYDAPSQSTQAGGMNAGQGMDVENLTAAGMSTACGSEASASHGNDSSQQPAVSQSLPVPYPTNIRVNTSVQATQTTNQSTTTNSGGQAKQKAAPKRKRVPYSVSPYNPSFLHNYYNQIPAAMMGKNGPVSTQFSSLFPPRFASSSLELVSPIIKKSKPTATATSSSSASTRPNSVSCKLSSGSTAAKKKLTTLKKQRSSMPVQVQQMTTASLLAVANKNNKPRTKLDAMRGRPPPAYPQALLSQNGLTQRFLQTNPNLEPIIASSTAPVDSTMKPPGPKEKPYKCQLCPKEFVYLKPYQDHMGQHNNQFKCSGCDQSFASQQWLLRHLQIGNCSANNSQANN